MATLYRTDWTQDDTGDAVHVRYADSLRQARMVARAKSSKHGSAYVIKRVDGSDVGQIPYYNGVADGRDWQTA